jgi:hypothetical protein
VVVAAVVVSTSAGWFAGSAPAGATRPSFSPVGDGAGAKRCVGSKPRCYATIQAALDAARDGDTIRVAAGTFAGGITIHRSITLVGAGARATIIKGGGPVVTIGEYLATAQPNVKISAVTIAGGVTTSSPESRDATGADNVLAAGGGIEINPSAGFAKGATVTVKDSVVTRNRVGPTASVPAGPPCPGGPCPFAWAKGGGIDTWGALTLTNTTVSNNIAGGAACDADGGGINVRSAGTLTLNDSKVTANHAIASAPNGRFAEGGGIFTDPRVGLVLRRSVVRANAAALTSTLPFEVGGGNTLDMNANGGGIHVGDDSSVTIANTTFRDNRARVDDSNGEPYAFDSALHAGSGPLSLRDSTIANNRVVANVGSSTDVGPSGSALDINGPATLSNVRITDNTTVVTSHAGAAEANGAVYAGDTEMQPIIIRNTVISGNIVRASSPTGSATVQGAGLVNDGRLQLRNDSITHNVGTATGTAGFARGGGIWNGSQFNPPPILLTIEKTKVTHNTLNASAGLAVEGGGVFTTFPITLNKSLIAKNQPDQCSGC